MAEYIEREALIAEYDRVHKGPPGGARKLMVDAPAADVVEVKRGCWIETDYRTFDGFETVVHPNEALKCSECCCCFRKELLWCKNYCPECGAKMDGKGGVQIDRT